jgi:drug/metabolite transporter (DMT)-like permease
MPKWVLVLLFVLLAAVSWGVYVPLVHGAAVRLQSNLRAFLFVGVAYFLVAVLVPSILIFLMNWDPTVKPGGSPNFNGIPIAWGIAAGVAGAIGALGVIFAAVNAGASGVLYVAPLVFAGAPIINTLATLYYFHPVKTPPDWKFFLGLVLAAAGAAMVMIFKPDDKAQAAKAAAVAPAAVASTASVGSK